MNEWNRTWDRKAGEGDMLSRAGRSRSGTAGLKASIDWVLASLDVSADDEVLDIGSGPGLISNELASYSKSVVALDRSHAMVKAGRIFHGKGAEFCWVVGDAHQLPFADRQFSRVLGYGVHQFMPSLRAFSESVSEIRRVLRPGGIAVLGANPDLELQENLIAKLQEENSSTDEMLRSLSDTLWMSRNTFVEICSENGLVAETFDIDRPAWYASYMFDAILRG